MGVVGEEGERVLRLLLLHGNPLSVTGLVGTKTLLDTISQHYNTVSQHYNTISQHYKTDLGWVSSAKMANEFCALLYFTYSTDSW